MANNGPNSNRQQFFITYAKQPHLNNVYTGTDINDKRGNPTLNNIDDGSTYSVWESH